MFQKEYKVFERYHTHNPIFVLNDKTINQVPERFEQIGFGIYRKVYQLTKTKVVKIPHDYDFSDEDFIESPLDCRRSNLAEALMYQNRGRLPLAKVHACSITGKWLVMDYAESLWAHYLQPEDAVEQALWNQANQCARKSHNGIRDLHNENIGWVKGKPRCIDYGENIYYDELKKKRRVTAND